MYEGCIILCFASSRCCRIRHYSGTMTNLFFRHILCGEAIDDNTLLLGLSFTLSFLLGSLRLHRMYYTWRHVFSTISQCLTIFRVTCSHSTVCLSPLTTRRAQLAAACSAGEFQWAVLLVCVFIAAYPNLVDELNRQRHVSV